MHASQLTGRIHRLTGRALCVLAYLTFRPALYHRGMLLIHYGEGIALYGDALAKVAAARRQQARAALPASRYRRIADA